MNQSPIRRLVAATVLAAVLSVLALPAAAAPANGWTLTWQLPTLLSWFDTVWTGWVGVEVADGTTPVAVYDPLKNAAEPNGINQASDSPSSSNPGEGWSPDGGSF